MLGDGYAAAERIALEPNGNPNYLLKPQTVRACQGKRRGLTRTTRISFT